MAITFPASPTNGQTFTSGNKTWQWDGTTWLAYGASLSPTVLKVDAANARVGINNQSPAYALDVNGTIEGTQFLQGTDYLSPYQGFRNKIINGGFDIWQRGTSIAGLNNATSYAADRWSIFRSTATNFTMSRQSIVSSELSGFNYCARFQRNSGDTSTSNMYLIATFESTNIKPLAGKTVTYSFYARKGANYSGGNLNLNIDFGTGTDTAPLTQPTSSATTTTSFVLTTSWQRFSQSVSVASTATAARAYWDYVPTGTAGANDYFEITGVQLEEGGVATPFEQRPIQTELALCQRYYEQERTTLQTMYWASDASGSVYGQSFIFSTPKRAAPTIRTYDSANTNDRHSTFNAGATRTDGRTNNLVDATSTGFSVRGYNVAGAYGYGFYWTADSEL